MNLEPHTVKTLLQERAAKGDSRAAATLEQHFPSKKAQKAEPSSGKVLKTLLEQWGQPAAEYRLPFPPSVNQYYRTVNGQPILSSRGRAFKRVALEDLQQQRFAGGETFGSRSVRVLLSLSPGDRRKRDSDNYSKATLDALTASGIWDDDSQVQACMAEWDGVNPEKEGFVIVRIWHAEDL